MRDQSGINWEIPLVSGKKVVALELIDVNSSVLRHGYGFSRRLVAQCMSFGFWDELILAIDYSKELSFLFESVISTSIAPTVCTQ